MIAYAHRRPPVLLTALCAVASSGVLADELRSPPEPETWRIDHFALDPRTFRNSDLLCNESVFTLALQPVSAVTYLTPSAPVSATGYGAVVTLDDLPPGRYTLVLTQDAAIEAILHKSNRTKSLDDGELVAEGGPLTLQLSGAPAPQITVGVFRLPQLFGTVGRAK